MIRDRAELVAVLEEDLGKRVLPHWRGTADRSRGGYAPRETFPTRWTRLKAAAGSLKRRLVKDPRPPSLGRNRHLVNQARLLWTFSHAHCRGYGGSDHDYRETAGCGYRFLTERLYDRRHGGFAWIADADGRVVDPRKILYGQAFALYALVEYHRATGLSEPLDYARALFDRIQNRMHDEAYSGWLEHCEADFTPLAPDDVVPGMPVTGLKSANAHLHVMEALAELAEVAPEAPVLSALEESVRINTTHFFGDDPDLYHGFRRADWKVLESGPDPVSYGHNLEFAWLLVRAQEVLGVAPNWDRFDAVLRHALRFGFDHVNGGFLFAGPQTGRRGGLHKVWWVQAEGLAALTDGLLHRSDAAYEDALGLLLAWIVERQRMANGLWAPNVDPRGRRLPILAHGAYKSAYHEVRGVVKLVEAFSPNRAR